MRQLVKWCGTLNKIRVRVKPFNAQQQHYDKLTAALRFDMTKQQVKSCRVVRFNGCIYIVNSQKDENRLASSGVLARLTANGIVGFDTETAFYRDSSAHIPAISIVQIASKDTAVLWKLRRSGHFLYADFPNALRDILSDPSILKIGTGITKDLQDLLFQYDVNTVAAIDNQDLAARLGFHRNGLQSLTAHLFGWTVSKSRRCSNWENPKLSIGHLFYAAKDAWASLLVFEKLKSLLEHLSVDIPTPVTATDVVVLNERKSHK